MEQKQNGHYRSNYFNYSITQHIATLSAVGDTSKELNVVSYNGAQPKLDIRSWKRTGDGEQILKGLTLTAEEAEALRDALNQLDLLKVYPPKKDTGGGFYAGTFEPEPFNTTGF